MRPSRALWVVARREITSRVRERSFLVSTSVTILLLVAVAALPALLGDDGPDVATVSVSGAPAERVARAAVEAAPAAGIRIAVAAASSDAAARADVRAGRADAAVLGPDPAIVVRRDLDDPLGLVLQDGAATAARERALAGADLDAGARRALLAPPPLAVQALEPGAADEAQAQAIASIVVLLLYGQLLIYGYWISAGVVEEKSSRVIEILLSAVPPRTLLLGKLLGLGLLGFAQLLLVAVVGAGVVIATGALDVPSGALAAVAVVLAFFVLGFALYAALYAVAGAIVPRQEDLQSSTTPLTILVLVSFFAAFSATNEPDGTLAQVLTFVPPCTPMVLPVRVLAGDVPAWEVALAVALLAASAVALIAVAVRIYRSAVLHTGGRMRLLDAWRSS